MPLSFKNENSVLIAGVVNLSRDSFYDGSRCLTEPEAVEKAERFVEEGADFLDVGAESSRPGSRPIPEDAELGLLSAVVPKLCKRLKIPVSVDTYKPRVAERMLGEGAEIVNDITGLQKFPEMAGVIARYKAGAILMHMRGSPETMQVDPQYQDVVGEIVEYLKRSVAIAEAAGIDPGKIAVDPGIGFGKTAEHNLELIRNLDRFKVLGKPILVGASRKSFIGNVLGTPAEDRLEGSLAVAVIAMLKGARILRVHDVQATVRAIKMAGAVLNPRGK